MAGSPYSVKSRDGVELSVAADDTSASGDTTVLLVDAGDRVKVYGVSISPDATLTGDIIMKLGSTQQSGKMRKAIVGGNHWLIPKDGNYILGGLGEDVVINNTVAEAISFVVYYVLVTP